MIMTYHWLMWANNNPKLKNEIENALSGDKARDIQIEDTFMISFDPKNQIVTVQASSEKCVWKHKIIPKKLTYHLVREVINGNWDAFTEENIFDIDES